MRARDWAILGAVVVVAYVLLRKDVLGLFNSVKDALPSVEKLTESVSTIKNAGLGGIKDVFMRQQNESAYVSQEQARLMAKEKLLAKQGGRRP